VRKKNGLSQRQAAEVMDARGVPIKVIQIKGWEQGQYLPSRLAVAVLERFLKEYPEIKDAPKHGKKSKLTAAELTEIGRLKAEGETTKAIG